MNLVKLFALASTIFTCGLIIRYSREKALMDYRESMREAIEIDQRAMNEITEAEGRRRAFRDLMLRLQEQQREQQEVFMEKLRMERDFT